MTARLATAAALSLLLGCQEYDFNVREQVDVFFQDPPPSVDVLLVIDNSGSMQAYQFLVGLRFNEFLTWFVEAGVDYQIAVTTTTIDKPTYPLAGCTQEDLDQMPDPGHLHLNTIITPETENAEDVFYDIVNVGTCGDGNRESGLEASRLALDPALLASDSAGFIRPDASLSVVYISDEQDYSFDPVYLYTNALYEAKGSRSRDSVTASALVVTDPNDCIIPIAGSTPGTRYMAITEQTGGFLGNLCNTNFAEAMVELSFNSARMKDEFVLTDLPATDTLEVSVNNVNKPCVRGDWSYELREAPEGGEQAVIVFDRTELPPPGSRVAVRYDFGTGDPEDFCPAADILGDSGDTGGAQ